MLFSILLLSVLFNVICICKIYQIRFRPEGLIKEYIKRFKKFWKVISAKRITKPGRPKISEDIKQIIKKIYLENSGIGGLRVWLIVSKRLGYEVSLSSVYRELRRLALEYPPKPPQQWKTFLYNSKVIAMDFTTVFLETSKDIFKEIFILIILDHERRRVLHYNLTPSPSQDWVVQQLKNCFDELYPFKYVIHDRDNIFMHRVRDVLPTYFQMESKSTAPHSPWENPFVESFHATLKRELVKRVVFKDESHLRKRLQEYIGFYNKYRMHSGIMDSPYGLNLYKDPPKNNALKKLKSVPV
ncbi:MAG: hypothetical protein BV456_13330, partial [Thermoplasmata archaeon M8B2D]